MCVEETHFSTFTALGSSRVPLDGAMLAVVDGVKKDELRD